ncbi:MAG: hypothetical protein NC038_00595 [Paludibacter sp.]|nr:hypothetical protein [Bacteroidales bacterium]MCM1068613.1 hypothetical protein [Prevotella sp.]MCM1353277.1 hypothetical protein [Bacteroides sp.]MCM1442315.1 hypothetical protein [Muribaculum sp.]MCM1481134.1 hypothetical protein [Paludibacter sp.]
MKKLIFSIALFTTVTASAQILEVASVARLATPVNEDTKVAGISPDGTYILLTRGTNEGLQKYDLQNNTIATLTDAAGAGYNAAISADGKEIVYRETTVGKDQLRRSALLKQNLTSGETAVVVEPTRDLEGFTVQGNTVMAVERKQLKTKALNTQTAMHAQPVVSIKDRQLMITVGGKTTVLSPNGQDKSYIWPSLSPDGTKVCYYVAGNGAWVANIDGSDVRFIGRDCRAAKWYNNSIIIGMADRDNGHVVTASDIVAYTLDGQKQVLTDGSKVAMYPYASADGSKIVFSTDNGEAWLISINVK